MNNEATHEPEPADGSLEAVGYYPDLGKAEEHALVAVAIDAECWLATDTPEEGGAGGFALLAGPEQAPRVREEVEAYEAELRDTRNAAPLEVPHFSPAPWLAFLWALTLSVAFILQDREPWLTDWGASSSLGIFEEGGWWRPFTALFLHADLPHLLGNIVFGFLFGPLVARSLGGVLGWTLVLAAGTAGNLLTAWLHYPDSFTSIGASTAVFGALGLLTGGGVLLAFLTPERAPWARVILPIGGGIALLGWLGTGDAGTDVLAHATGFLFGLPLGFAALRARLGARAGKPDRA